MEGRGLGPGQLALGRSRWSLSLLFLKAPRKQRRPVLEVRRGKKLAR